MKISFTKMHGLGNDFIIIDNRKNRYKNLKKISKRLCDRRFGIGADQLLVLARSKKADFRMVIYNSDGSEVEMCGNGIRCIAQYVWNNNLKRSNVLAFETRAGIIRPEKSGQLTKVDMGKPVFDPRVIPVLIDKKSYPHSLSLPKGRTRGFFEPAINLPVKVKKKTFKITCVSMGNPHAVIIVKNVDSVPLHEFGPLLENHRLFPNRTNVNFIQILNRKNIKMRVWERGAGETPACGTGASASAVKLPRTCREGNF
jgi:diaminopimelate epimerase